MGKRKERICPVCDETKRNFAMITVGGKRKFICQPCVDWLQFLEDRKKEGNFDTKTKTD